MAVGWAAILARANGFPGGSLRLCRAWPEAFAALGLWVRPGIPVVDSLRRCSGPAWAQRPRSPLGGVTSPARSCPWACEATQDTSAVALPGRVTAASWARLVAVDAQNEARVFARRRGPPLAEARSFARLSSHASLKAGGEVSRVPLGLVPVQSQAVVPGPQGRLRLCPLPWACSASSRRCSRPASTRGSAPPFTGLRSGGGRSGPASPDELLPSRRP